MMAVLQELLTGIYTKQITMDNMYKSTTEQWHLHQWAQIKLPPGNSPYCWIFIYLFCIH
jgi:hypothetical protein